MTNRSADTAGMRTQALKVPGMPCPDCNTPIVIDPMVLLAALPVECPACGLELRINAKKSADTLNALGVYMEEFESVQADYQQKVGDMTGERRRRSRGERAGSRRPRRPRRGRGSTDREGQS